MFNDTTIYQDNDYTAEFAIVKKLAADGSLVPATGIIDLYIDVAATMLPGDAGIDPTLKVLATERAQKPGNYFVTLLGANITAKLFPTYDGKYVYVRAVNTAQDIRVVSKVAVRSVRRSS